jgi:hypothetical protein
MQYKQMTLAAAIAAALMMMNTAQAESWEITQNTTIGTNTELEQKTSTSATQAINAVNFDGTNTNVKGTQTTAMGTSTLKLKQTGSNTSSTQAANYVKANTIADSLLFTQTHTGGGSVTLDQAYNDGTLSLQGGNRQAINMADSAKDGTGVKINTVKTLEQLVNSSSTVTLNQSTGANNLQAVNHIEAGTVNGAKQEARPGALVLEQNGAGLQTQAINNIDAETVTTVTQTTAPTSSLSLQQQGGGNKKIQAANNIKANTLTKATQTTTPAGNVTLKQNSTSASEQAANRADGGTTNAVGDLTQVVTFGTGTHTITQDSSGVQTQALNMAITDKGVSGISGVDQSVDNSAADILFQQGNTTTVGNGSRQAGNYLKNKGLVTKVAQTLGATGSAKIIKLEQAKAGATNTVQAGNLIDLSTISSGLTSGTQRITADGATTGELNLNQTETKAVLQAGNAVITDGTGLGGKLSQTGTLTKLTMLQDTANKSFQATNYLGQEIQ